MSEGRNETAGPPGITDHEIRHVDRIPEGGFSVKAGNCGYRVVATGSGWRIEGSDEFDGWSLRRAREAGFVLQRSDGDAEAARSMPLVGTGAQSGLRFVLLEDGRLFRIALRGPRDGHYELTGWETSGAYLLARPEPEGWSLRPTTASGGLSEIHVLCLMLAAEVLDADEALRTGSS